jgi:hypothetical protein
MVSRRTLLASAAIAVAAVAANEAPPTTGETRETRIRRLEEFYARVYGEPLSTTERLPRQIAIVSLSRIDAAPITDRLMEAFKAKDRDPVIQYLAWEALHARHQSLTSDQRRRWATGGLKAALNGAFPGATVTPLLLALSEHHPTALEGEPGQLAVRVVRENDLDDESGKAALDALRQLVSAWHDPRLVRLLVAQLNKKPNSPELAKRVDHVLRGLPEAPPEGKDPRTAWNAANEKIAKLKVASSEELKPYSGTAGVFSAPAKITDPNDPRWRAELEITKLAVSDFDLVWCIDATGSMNDENQLVARETGLVMRVCGLVSKRARCGTIYFRHETDPALMEECCERAKANPQWYQVKGYPLTERAAELSKTMAAERIPRPDPMGEGNVHPGGAFHAALKAAVEQMPWSKDRGARKAVVLVGDSRLTAGSESACAKLVKEAKSHGFQVHALVKGAAIRSWPDAVEPGGGVLLPFMTEEDLAALPEDAPFRRRRMMMMAGDANPRAVFGKVAAVVIRDSVAQPYRDRVDPLVKILLKYAEASEAAERAEPR